MDLSPFIPLRCSRISTTPVFSSTWGLLPIALLPVNHRLLLDGERQFRAMFTSQFCPLHVRIGEIARLKIGLAKVGISQVRPHEIDRAEI